MSSYIGCTSYIYICYIAGPSLSNYFEIGSEPYIVCRAIFYMRPRGPDGLNGIYCEKKIKGPLLDICEQFPDRDPTLI